MYTFMCCADVRGGKVNLEITLESPPESVKSMTQQLEKIFLTEIQALSGKVPSKPFRIEHVWIYDDSKLNWTALKCIDQVHEYDQLYVFQPQSDTHRDAQQDLPPPRPPLRSRAASAVAGLFADGLVPAGTWWNSSGTSSQHTSQSSLHPIPLYEVPFPPAECTPVTQSRVGVPKEMPNAPYAERTQPINLEQSALLQRLQHFKSDREALINSATQATGEKPRLQELETNQPLRNKEEEMCRQRESFQRAKRDFQEYLHAMQRVSRSPKPAFVPT
ncbi:hypothetical protein STCU_01677 [Strigomonas culicis]|uniref:Uncharacterized protein n=1 Tax=Strigomonas culicis TaxID=28005 RepID=S9UZU3_9TRYP|nr:hypothetical protein STCU_01677 [Strigomonas culicis]|eukprot:EPY34293.1 hypothetical protein STCU_01677 [Strigomonas culicis]